MRILDRYVLKELGPPFVICGALFTFFLIIDRIYQLTDLVVTKGVPFRAVAGLLVFMVPSFLIHTLPVALLVALLLAAGRLAGDLEVVALRASGVSPFRLFRPFLLAAVVVTGVTGVLTLGVTPWANEAFQHHRFEILRTRVATGIKERVFNTTFDRLVIYVEELTPSREGLRGVVVADERNPKLSRIISAPQGRLLTDEENGRIVLRFIDGALHESEAGEPRHYRYTTFGVYDMNLSIDSLFSSAPRVRKPERNLSLRELLAATKPDGKGETVAPYEVELHKRFALPLAALVFALVGFALGTRSPRGGRAIALGGSLAIIVSYYLLVTSLERIALMERIPSWLAIWSPNLLFSSLGLVLFRAPRVEVPRKWAERLSSRGDSPARPTRPSERPAGPPRAGDRILGSWFIDRYLIREHLIYFGHGLAVGAVLIVTGRLFHAVHHYLRTGPPLRAIVEHLAYLLPGELYRGLPVVTLVATIFLFASMARQHELTALKAAGVSLYRIALPIVLVGLGVSIASVAFQETLLPMLNAKAEEVAWVEIKGRPPRDIQRQARLWYRSSNGDFFRVELLDPVEQVMDDVTVFQIDREFRIRNRLDARQARWAPRGWEFREGIFREFAAGSGVEARPFEVTTLELPETLQDLAQIHHSPEEMSFLELRAYLRRLQESGHKVGKYLVKLYAKLSFPVIHLIIPLVAIPFAIAVPAGGRIIGIALAILITAGYWFVHSLAISFARADMLPPLLAAWTANLVFAGLGISLFLRART
ncbi:MAG: LPS export ABC transporter permease LptF [Candidatus Methylomirabilia bacterium]